MLQRGSNDQRAGWLALLMVAVVSTLPSVAAGAPLVEPGWPVQTHGFGLVAAPNGGIVTSGTVDVGIGLGEGVVAFNRDGSRRWANWFGSGCGNCADPAPLHSWPDGSFRTIGSDRWGVDSSGTRIPGCPGGVVRKDGLCIARSKSMFPNGPGAIAATRVSGEVAWTFDDPRAVDNRDDWFGVDPIVADGDGVLYADFVDPGGGSEAGTSWLAILTPDGNLHGELSNAGALLGGLPSGVLLGEQTALVARDAGGNVLWRRESYTSGELTSHRTRVALDDARGIVYLQTPLSAPRHRIEALDVATGARLWQTTGYEMHSVGRSGTLYLGDRWGLRALTPNGLTAWRFRLPPGRLTGAAELTDGRVAAIARGLLYRLRPSVQVPAPRGIRARIRRRVISAGCGAYGEKAVPCSLDRRGGAVLSLLLPRPTRVTIRATDPRGRPVRSARRSYRMPPGRSDVVALQGGHGTPLRPGRYRIIVRLAWSGGRSNRAFRVRAIR